MNAWEYLTLNVAWVPSEGVGTTLQPDIWRYAVSEKWAADYADVISDCHQAQNTEALWDRLGAGGWDLVTSVEHRRDQYSETRRFRKPQGAMFRCPARLSAFRTFLSDRQWTTATSLAAE